jgi:hypothetical protein
MQLFNHSFGTQAGSAPNTGIPTVEHQLIDKQHPLRARAEQFIAQRFDQVHRARISVFMPVLIAVIVKDEIRAVAGIRDASEQPLFLEHYLDQPVERAISSKAESTAGINRRRIAEIGNLASVDRQATLKLYPLLARYLDQHGYDWAVFTGCSSLQRMFRLLGIRTVQLGRALQSRLPADQQTWGSYYEDNPSVVAGKVSGGCRVLGGFSTSSFGGFAA